MRARAALGRSFAMLGAIALGASIASAESPAVRVVRNLRALEQGVPNPEGAVWLPGSSRWVVMQSAGDDLKLAVLETMGEPAGAVTLAGRRVRPENSAFDAKRSRLVMLDDVAGELIVAGVSPEGSIDVANPVHLPAPMLGPVRAAGIAIDGSTGALYVLDRLSRRIAIVPEAVWSAGVAGDERVGWIELDAIDAADLRGLGWDAAAQRWFLLDAATATLIAVDGGGLEVGRWELDATELVSPRGLAVAPTGDPTDATTKISVYIADAGNAKLVGSLVEFKFRTDLPLQVAATVAGALVRQINTNTWSPPSPDPSGITYDKNQGRLIISDGEVDEMSIYSGANIYECTLSGTLLRTSNTLRFSNEPTGIAFDTPSRSFITDDSGGKVYTVNHGADGHVGGSDDTWTVMSPGIGDAEGISYDKANNRLFTGDGVGEEIWQIRAGSDGNFGTSDDQITHFDTSVLGIIDPETVEYSSITGTLYIIGKGTDKIVETSVVGALLNTITLPSTSMKKPAGICIGPNSTNSALSSLYIADRQVDNDSHPSENDGKVYEITASVLPPFSGGGGGGGGTTPPPGTDFPMARGSDDAEQAGTSVSTNGTDLELVVDGSTVQTVGLRFSGVTIPRNAEITNAWIQFTSDEDQSIATALRIEGQAADNPLTFTSATSNVSSRPRTTEFVNWNPTAAWGVNDGAGPNQKTPSLVPIVQALVNRSGWASGNAMAFIFTGSGRRTAKSYEAGSTAGPVLHIELATSNTPPVVIAGPDLPVTLPAGATLAGSVTDDGLPTSGTLTRQWTRNGGTAAGTVTFANANSASTTATFSSEGTYILRLTGNDGALTAFDEMTVTVSPEPPPVSGGTPFPVRTGSDDAEQGGTSVATGGGDLELVTDATTVQTVGLRFSNITVAKNAIITNAWIQFNADEEQSEATTLRIEGQAVDSAGTFTPSSNNISARPRTAQFVNWSPVAWGVNDGAGVNQKTGDLKSIVQVLVNRPGWKSGNAIAFIITGTGHRTAVAYEGASARAAVLYIEVGTGPPPVNTKPTVSAGPNREIILPASASLDGTVSDDGLPSGTLTQQWTKQSGPLGATVTFVDPFAVDTQASFSDPGLYLLRLTASDGELSEFAEMQVSAGLTVGGGGGTPVTFEKRVAASSDDAEQSSTGSTSLSSSDLELVLHNTDVQVVGMRFTGLTIPKNATITNAWIQFTRDESHSGVTNLTIAGEASDNAATFVKAANNVSNRPRTTATVSWSPAAWVNADVAGPNQKTPSLTAIVQELVNRSNWVSGNSMAFIVTGSGVRNAKAYDGAASAAALLRVEYTTP